MSSFMNIMHERAKIKQKTIVFPEGIELRIIQAARIIVDTQLASTVILLGDEHDIMQHAAEHQVLLDGIRIIDPCTCESLDAYTAVLYNKRKHKGLTEKDAREQLCSNTIAFGCMMVHMNDADVIVAGAVTSTAVVLQSAITIIGVREGQKTASSCFIMEMPDQTWGHNGFLIFSDCAVVPNPNANQLADIAISAAESCVQFLEATPCVALLSFSTYGSAKTDETQKVLDALAYVRTHKPDLLIDGEMQVDAALVSLVAEQKAPGSVVAGHANVLVFPDLQSGNIGYKLVQRLGHAAAYGPLLQGFAKPISDLSRGCSVTDIVNTAALTIAQA